jgi:hypothetical protein
MLDPDFWEDPHIWIPTILLAVLAGILVALVISGWIFQ